MSKQKINMELLNWQRDKLVAQTQGLA